MAAASRLQLHRRRPGLAGTRRLLLHRHKHMQLAALQEHAGQHGGRSCAAQIDAPAAAAAHLDTIMTLKPWAFRSRTISTMAARLVRLRVPASARIREEVPTLITCGGRLGAGRAGVTARPPPLPAPAAPGAPPLPRAMLLQA